MKKTSTENQIKMLQQNADLCEYNVIHKEPGHYTDKEIELRKTSLYRQVLKLCYDLTIGNYEDITNELIKSLRRKYEYLCKICEELKTKHNIDRPINHEFYKVLYTM